MARTATQRPLGEHVKALSLQRNQVEVNSDIPLEVREEILEHLGECLKSLRRLQSGRKKKTP
jgi:hypothetical protein